MDKDTSTTTVQSVLYLALVPKQTRSVVRWLRDEDIRADPRTVASSFHSANSVSKLRRRYRGPIALQNNTIFVHAAVGFSVFKVGVRNLLSRTQSGNQVHVNNSYVPANRMLNLVLSKRVLLRCLRVMSGLPSVLKISKISGGNLPGELLPPGDVGFHRTPPCTGRGKQLDIEPSSHLHLETFKH
ncbi:hypothetical protein B0H14DRAFT_3133730 [Mycena olivaceomarginata]|nr:hypothetical protein B0H14DRAFT_3133730 [Mycena olivaceomarginata]